MKLSTWSSLGLALVGVSAGAEDTMKCFRRATASEDSAYVTCPGANKDGYLPNISVTDNKLKLTYSFQGTDGRVHESQLTAGQVDRAFGSDMYSFKIGLRRPSTPSGGWDVSGSAGADQLRDLGFDTSKTGNVGKLYLTQIEMPKNTDLYEEPELKTLRPAPVAGIKVKCIYVGDMKILKTTGRFCGSEKGLCVAAVECQDPKIGWTTSTVSCAANGDACPVSADSCANEEGSVAGITSAKIVNTNQPHGSNANKTPEATK